ncbi:dynamin family protein [Corynebacterium sp. ACRPH]|uniref:dynamin family protein n=1 Tax=Corynebacterium sp. ACRPH TaxID=2918199 RepID=UPI001EF2BD91|nr:dynamin family protein [Corynebacterium sp. ACRPH]
MTPTPNAPGRSPQASVERGATIARKYKMHDAADRVQNLVNAKYRTSAVVIIGEVKRGKSSLVNALVGRRDLLPVDVITATSAPIRIHTEPDQDPDQPVLARLVRGTEYDPIEPEDLKNWVTQEAVDAINRAPKDSKEVASLPSAAELLVPYSGMGKVTIIDTPGVGGLDEHAVAASLAEARNAGVLLMVCDASTPITAPEMDILRRAREQVGSVIVAVTKTDKNVRRWRSIVADDQRLIAEHLGLDIPVIGVSSLRALDAAESASPEKRAQIEQRCGIAELRQQIIDHVNSPGNLGTVTALEITKSTMHTITTDIERDIKLYDKTSDAVGELEAEKRKLEAFRDATSEWEQLFMRDIQLSRNKVSAAMDEALTDVKTRWTNRVNAEGMRVLRSKPQVFTSQIEIELRQIMEQMVMAMVSEVTARAAQLFQGRQDMVDQVQQQIFAALAPPSSLSHDVEKKTTGLVDPSMLTMGIVGAGALTVVIPFAPVAAAAWIGVNMGYRAMRNGKQHLLIWLRETIATTRTSINRMIDIAITTGRTEILLRHRSAIRQEQRNLQSKIESAQKIARESEAQRKQTVSRLKKNLEIVNQTIEELDGHLAALKRTRRGAASMAEHAKAGM